MIFHIATRGDWDATARAGEYRADTLDTESFIHCSEAHRDEVRRSMAALNGVADLVLLAGDLTTHGEPEQGAVLAEVASQQEAADRRMLGCEGNDRLPRVVRTAVIDEKDLVVAAKLMSRRAEAAH